MTGFLLELHIENAKRSDTLSKVRNIEIASKIENSLLLLNSLLSL